MSSPFAPVGADVSQLRYDQLGTVDPAAGDRPDAAAEAQAVHFNSPAGPRWSGGGYGLVNGKPYGNALQGELGALQSKYRLRPRVYARLRAATRKALGR